MDRIAAFLEMGGRAAFVWPAYGLTVAVLALVLVLSLRTTRARKRRLGEGERHVRGGGGTP